MSNTVENLADFLGCESVAELGALLAEALEVGNGNNGNGNVKVDIADTVVAITSPVETQVEISGDVRDGTVTLQAGKTKTRKLTDEGHGYITVDGVKHERP